MEVKEIPIADIRLTGLNARKDLDAGLEDSSVGDLAKSIEETANRYKGNGFGSGRFP